MCFARWGGQERLLQQEFLRHLQAKLHLKVRQGYIFCPHIPLQIIRIESKAPRFQDCTPPDIFSCATWIILALSETRCMQVPQVASTVCHQIEEELQGTLANVCALVEGSQHAMYRWWTVLH